MNGDTFTNHSNKNARKMTSIDASIRSAAFEEDRDGVEKAFALVVQAEASSGGNLAFTPHPSTYAILAERAVALEQYDLARAVVSKFLFTQPPKDQVRLGNGL